MFIERIEMEDVKGLLPGNTIISYCHQEDAIATIDTIKAYEEVTKSIYLTTFLLGEEALIVTRYK